MNLSVSLSVFMNCSSSESVIVVISTGSVAGGCLSGEGDGLLGVGGRFLGVGHLLGAALTASSSVSTSLSSSEVKR